MSLTLAPVQLLDYAIVEQSYVRHVPGDNSEAASVQSVQVNVNGQRDEAGINLLVDVYANRPEEEDDSEHPPYAQEGHIRAAGRFRWIGEEHPPDEERLLVVNGVSFLYGIARVYLAQASSVSPGPRMMLPSFSFRDVEVVVEEAEAAEPPASDPALDAPAD